MVRAGANWVVLLLFIAGCERQVPPDGIQDVVGYEVQGTVMDQLGNPVPGVKVYVDYSSSLVYGDSAVTRSYFVADPSAVVGAEVVDWSGRTIRILAQPQHHYGAYQELWDGTDSTGNLLPSGIYYVQYLVNGVVRFSYSQLVTGGQVTTTDSQGQYTIPQQNLPIGPTSVPYFSSYDSTYLGNLYITNFVAFTFTYPNHSQQIGRSLDKGQVTIVNVVFH